MDDLRHSSMVNSVSTMAACRCLMRMGKAALTRGEACRSK